MPAPHSSCSAPTEHPPGHHGSAPSPGPLPECPHHRDAITSHCHTDTATSRQCHQTRHWGTVGLSDPPQHCQAPPPLGP